MEKLEMKWALYMKPHPYNEELFRLLKESNAYLITLTVDSDKTIQALNNYSYDDLTKIIEYCKKYDIRLAIDLLTGYPNESFESTKEMLEFFKDHRPSMVGISYIYRIYKHTGLAELIRKDSLLQKNLTRVYSKEENFLEPIFYKQHDHSVLAELVEGDEIFNFAGLKPGVNYQF